MPSLNFMHVIEVIINILLNYYKFVTFVGIHELSSDAYSMELASVRSISGTARVSEQTDTTSSYHNILLAFSASDEWLLFNAIKV